MFYCTQDLTVGLTPTSAMIINQTKRVKWFDKRYNIVKKVDIKVLAHVWQLMWKGLPLLALSTCSSSSGNLRISGYFSSHFSAKKCRRVIFWSVDLVSRSCEEKTQKSQSVRRRAIVIHWECSIDGSVNDNISKSPCTLFTCTLFIQLKK